LHAPEVVCIAKGKARTPYEFGAKVGIAVTNREGLVLAAKAFAGNPYDGHTLAATLDQATSVSGVTPERIYVDKGYRGHNYTGAGQVMIAGRRRGLSATMRRELRRRSAIEATIGHMKTDGRLDRNFLLGQAGDAINALLAAAGHNLRLVLAALALWLAFILAAIAKAIAKANTSVCVRQAEPSMT
jgi:transposase, IS5 family